MDYYDEVIQEISTSIKEGNLDEASFLLKREFSMPYIPPEAEEALRALDRELRYQRSEKKETSEIPLERLLNMLRGKPESQLRAANLLCERNLRLVARELRDWLSKDPLPEAAALILEGLAEQEVAEEFSYTKDGVEYEFYGDALTPVAKSGGCRKALELLNRRYMKEPSMLEMAKTLLAGMCYMALPISYEEVDGEMLAKAAEERLETALNAANETR